MEERSMVQSWRRLWTKMLLWVVIATPIGVVACTPPVQIECEKTSDCKPGFYCDLRNNKCRERTATCTLDVDCGNNERCDNGSCVAKTTETVTPDGGNNEQTPENNNGLCGSRKSCTNFSDCASGETCNSGCCTPTCDANKPCPDGLKCLISENRCVDCLVDGDCGGGSTLCESSANCSTALVKRCASNTCADAPCECGVGESCNATSGKCESQKTCPGGVPPDASGNCPTPCPGVTCPSGQTPDPANNCTCIARKSWCEPCTTNAECGLTGLCVDDDKGNKYCAEDCGPNRGAQEGTCSDSQSYSCFFDGKNKFCKPSLGYCPCLGTQCQGGQKCCPNTGQCQQCCNNQDCQAPQICHNVTYICTQDLCAGKTCPSGQQCDPSDGQCKTNNSGPCPQPCQPGTCCNTTTLQCTASACQQAACNPPCASGQDCCAFGGQNTCVPTGQCPTGSGGGCTSDAQCTNPGERCCDLFGMGRMCMDTSDPIIGLLCSGGSGSCQSDADCRDPAAPRCCPGLLPPITPNSCKASCGGFP